MWKFMEVELRSYRLVREQMVQNASINVMPLPSSQSTPDISFPPIVSPQTHDST